MKLGKLILSPPSHRLKMGVSVDPLGFLGQIIGIDAQSEENARSLSAQSAENEKNRQFNASESEKQRQWQADEWSRQFDLQNQQWYRQFGWQNAEWTRQADYSNDLALRSWYQQQQYNSPAAIAGRLKQAGANPSAVLNAQTYGSTGLSAASTSVGSPSTPNPSVPAASAASFNGGVNPPITNYAQMFSSIANGVGTLITSLSSSKKDNALAKQTNELTPHLVKGTVLDNVNKGLMNAWQTTENLFQGLSFNPRLKKLKGESDLIFANVALANSQADLNRALMRTEHYRTKLVENNSLLSFEQFRTAYEEANNVKNIIELRKAVMESEKDKNVAQAASSFANAFAARAFGKTEDELRPLKVQNQKLQNSISSEIANGAHRENVIAEATKDGRIHLLIEAARRADVITAREMVELEKAITDKEFQVLDKFVKYVDTGFSAYRNFGIGKNALTPSPGRPAFDPNAGNSFIMDDDTGLLFKAPWNR